MGRRPTALVTGALVLAALFALVIVSGVGAFAFADEPCLPTPDAQKCPDGFVDALYSIKLEPKSGAGAGPPYSCKLIADSLPSGIELRSDCVITGTPTQAGTAAFWAQIFDNVGNPGSQQRFSLTINPRVLVTTAAAGPGTTGVSYAQALSAVMKSSPTINSPPSSQVTWTVPSGQLPPGLTLGATDGVISGTPTTEGSFSFVVQATLADGRSDTKALTIAVRAPVAIAAQAVPRSEIGVPFRLALAASGGTGTYTWSLTSGALPSGVAMGTNGTIVGTPSAAGTFRFTATATDAEGRKADYAGVLTVAQRLAIATQLLRPAKVGRTYRQKIVTIGGVLPKLVTVALGPLPPRMRFDRTLGVLTGIPTKPGTYRITFRAVDALRVQATKTLRLVVRP